MRRLSCRQFMLYDMIYLFSQSNEALQAELNYIRFDGFL